MGNASNIEDASMQTAKQQAEEVRRRLPDDATLEDILCRLYVWEKTRKEQNDIPEARPFTHFHAKERMSRWLEM